MVIVAAFRLLVFGFIILSIIYLSVSILSRSRRVEKLENRWEREDRPGDREEYVRAGLERYEASFRRKLLWGIYILPVIVIAVLIYAMNF